METEFVEIDCIQYNAEREDVYDIEVENIHSFFANDFLAHNCIAGLPAKIVFDHQTTPDWKLWVPNNDNFELIQTELAQAISGFQEALGPENYYLELQWNKLSAQHLVNMHLIEASKRTGAKLVATADAHYSDPAHWREREIYKAIGWGMKGGKAEALPESVAELKCELYPKNAQQMWDSFLHTAKEYDFYDQQVVKEAIERTHDIAHQHIGEVSPDRSIKLPAITKLVPENDLIRIQKSLGDEGKETDDESVAFRELRELAVVGLKWRKKTSQEYIDRLRVELDTVKHLKFSRYFLTYFWIMKVVSEKQLIGNARGSAGGSLLAYVLNITQMDPIKHGLLFERFLSKKKLGLPDIDCLASDMRIQMASGVYTTLKETKVGDVVIDTNNQPKKVLAVQLRSSNKEDKLFRLFLNVGGVFGSIVANHKHRMIRPDGSQILVADIQPMQELKSSCRKTVVVAKVPVLETIELADITVEDSATFHVVPYDVATATKDGKTLLVGINTYTLDSDIAILMIHELEQNGSARNCQITELS